MGLTEARTNRSRRSEQAFPLAGGKHRQSIRGWRRGEGRVALQGRQHAVGEEAHVHLGLLVRQAAKREFGDEVVHPGAAPQLGDFFEAVLRRADDLDADVEIGRLGF